MKTTKRKFLDSLRGIGAFVAPYKRAFLFAIPVSYTHLTLPTIA